MSTPFPKFWWSYDNRLQPIVQWANPAYEPLVCVNSKEARQLVADLNAGRRRPTFIFSIKRQ